MHMNNSNIKKSVISNIIRGFLSVLTKSVGIIVSINLLFLVNAEPCNAELQVDITRGVVKPIPVAVTNFLGSSQKELNLGRNIALVVKADLVRSGLFSAVDEKAYIDVEKSIDTKPAFGNWRILKAQALSQGKVELIGNKSLKVQFRLWDVFAEQQ